MNKIIKKDALTIINDTIEILKEKEEKDIIELKNLSNHTIHNASIFQDECSVSLAILVYSLSKVIERKFGELDYKPILNLLQDAESKLNKDKIDDYNNTIKKLFELISNIDSKLKLYIEEVIRQAQVKKGGQLYKHGISIERASEILGISQWELMNYIGHTKMTDFSPESLDIKNRIEFTRGLFR